MDSQNEPMYCAQQINIPPELPDILKQFTKAAIRTQPTDVLEWSCAYFEALAKGEPLPVKERIDLKLGNDSNSSLTQASVKVLHKQLGDRPVVEFSNLQQKWNSLSLPKESLDDIMRIGSFGEDIKWPHFLALCCSSTAENITLALKAVCEVLTKDLDGGPARIDLEEFKALYTYLANIDGDISSEQVDKVVDHLEYNANQDNLKIDLRPILSDSAVAKPIKMFAND